MGAFEQLWAWQEPETAEVLGWYLDVACNRKPAKFRIAATIATDVDLKDAAEAELWAELERLTPVFLARRAAVRSGAERLGPRSGGPSLLELCAALVARMLAHCNFCRWDCGVDRTQGGKPGACKLAHQTRVSTYFHHPGEELVYRGLMGSGTIFFTSCNMRCAFCQNGDISTDKNNGTAVEAPILAAMAWLLRLEGCHNINWVGGDPTIHLHTIVDAIALLGQAGYRPSQSALRRARPIKGDYFMHTEIIPGAGTYAGAFNAPMLWNSNFYMSDEAMTVLRLLMDVWLPDFKFGPGRCAVTLARTPRYWDTVTRNLALIHGWGEDQTIRHLVMPGHVECCTYPVLDWIAAHMPEVPVNIMDQYRPENFCDPANSKYDPRYAAIARRPRREEIRAALGHAHNLGLNFESITYERTKTGVRV